MTADDKDVELVVATGEEEQPTKSSSPTVSTPLYMDIILIYVHMNMHQRFLHNYNRRIWGVGNIFHLPHQRY